MRVFPLHGIVEVAMDPFAPAVLVGDAAGEGVLDGALVFDEEVGDVGEEEDRHFFFAGEKGDSQRRAVEGMGGRGKGKRRVLCGWVDEGMQGRWMWL